MNERTQKFNKRYVKTSDKRNRNNTTSAHTNKRKDKRGNNILNNNKVSLMAVHKSRCNKHKLEKIIS